MFCNGCGQVMAVGQSVCGRCGRASQAAGLAPIMPLALVEGRVNLLAYGWLTYAALEAMMGGAAFIFARAFMDMHMNHGWGGPFWMGPHLPYFLMKVAWVAVLVRVTLAALSGYGLLKKTAWGRWVAIVTAVLSLLHPVLGFIMAIWTLVVLLNRMNAAGYDAMAEG